MDRHTPLLNSGSTLTAMRSAWTRHLRTLLSVLTVASIGLLSACGGSDESADDSTSQDGGENTQPEAPTDDGEPDADTGGAVVLDPAVVRACLSDAGYETASSSELLSEQQVQDVRTAFGQTEGLTFDASAVAFAGGVTFFETSELAAERAQDLADVAKAQRVIGNAMISVEAGSDFDDAVAAAEACLTE